jgi:hypothetical protein
MHMHSLHTDVLDITNIRGVTGILDLSNIFDSTSQIFRTSRQPRHRGHLPLRKITDIDIVIREYPGHLRHHGHPRHHEHSRHQGHPRHNLNQGKIRIL